MNPAQVLSQALKSSRGEKVAGLELHQLAGDASTRRYYRAKTPEGTAILQLTEAFQGKNEFLLVQEFLAQSGIRVPKVLAYDSAAGAVLQEDVGDLTMLSAIAERGPKAYEKKSFEEALDLLVAIHERAIPSKFSGQIKPAGFALAFDEEKLMWEVNFTLEHFFQGYLQKPLSSSESGLVKETFQKIVHELAAQPRVYTHRDYHSRNLMVAPSGELVAIDFQDARMGLRQYDLASILRDSYYQLEEEKVYAGVDYYLNKTKANRTDFLRHFDLMSIQRNFKALGTFGFQASQRKNSYYLRFVGNTFENIRRNLAKDPAHAELARILCLRYYG